MDAELLVVELKAVRRGRGASLMKLMASPVLYEALGSPIDPVEELAARTEALGSSIQARALVNALALGMSDPKNLTQRRADFAVQNDKSVDTIEAYEAEMIEELAAILMVNVKTELSREDVASWKEGFHRALESIVAWMQTENERQESTGSDKLPPLRDASEQASDHFREVVQKAADNPDDINVGEIFGAMSGRLIAGGEYDRALSYQQARVELLGEFIAMFREVELPDNLIGE